MRITTTIEAGSELLVSPGFFEETDKAIPAIIFLTKRLSATTVAKAGDMQAADSPFPTQTLD